MHIVLLHGFMSGMQLGLRRHMPSLCLKHSLCSVWDIIAAKHAAMSEEAAHATVVAYVSEGDPWSASMRNSTLACKAPLSPSDPFLACSKNGPQCKRIAPLCSIMFESGVRMYTLIWRMTRAGVFCKQAAVAHKVICRRLCKPNRGTTCRPAQVLQGAGCGVCGGAV